jgi:DNA-binding transcriptional MocR family regulator
VEPGYLDFELTQTLFRGFKPKLFVLCSALSNPSGATVPNEIRKALVELCRETGTRILEDEIYGELSEIPHLKPIRAYDDGSTVSYVTSFSKTVAPGLRVGVCLPGLEANAFALQKCQQDMHSATLCEVAFRRYFETGRFDSHLNFLRRLNRERRELGLRIIGECFPASPKFGNLPAVSCCGLSCHRTSKSKRFIEARLLKTSRFAMALRFLLPRNNNSWPCASIVRAPARNSSCKVSGSWGELWNERGRASQLRGR